MKVAVLLALLALANAATIVCPTVQKCVGKGKTCSITYDSNGFDTSDIWCTANLGCQLSNATSSSTQSYTGTCAALPTAGQACLVVPYGDSGCADNLYCDPTSKTCKALTAAPRTRYPGQSCSGTDVCKFTNMTDVLSGNVNVCNSGTCLFTADGGNCTILLTSPSFATSQCKLFSSYCASTSATSTTNPVGTCTPLIADGGACTVGQFSCKSGSVGYSTFPSDTCMPSATSGAGALTGKCGGFFSLAAGAPCASDNQCGGNMFCGNVGSGNTFGVCTAASTSATLHKTCADSTNCATDGSEICSCNSKYNKAGSAVCLSTASGKDIQKDFTSYLNCIVKNNCQGDSCDDTKCVKESCSYLRSSFNDFVDPAQGCQGGACGAGSSVVASVFFVATFVAFLLF